jgi:hypothetical protein
MEGHKLSGSEKGIRVKNRIWIGIFVAAAGSVVCGPSVADTVAQAQPSPRTAADAFLHRSALLRFEYQQSNKPALALQDLLAGRYDALETDLNKAEADFERDPAYEFAFYDVLHAIVDCATASPDRGAIIEAWVTAHPKSAWSHLMLGRFYEFAGCQARGEGWARDVTDEQWTKMQAMNSQARPEVLEAEHIDPKHLPIYTALLSLSRSGNDPDGMGAAYEAGRKLFPTSYNLPLNYMEGLRPRWYGSDEAMDEFAESIKTQTKQNPLFWVFQGSADADEADAADRAGDLRSALDLYKAALHYGDQSPWLAETALIEWKLQDVGSALQYYRRDELYEIPLSQKIKSQEEQLDSYCASIQAQCQSNPKNFPWYGEPEFPQTTP